jgi:hypothetical protein
MSVGFEIRTNTVSVSQLYPFSVVYCLVVVANAGLRGKEAAFSSEKLGILFCYPRRYNATYFFSFWGHTLES